MAQKKSSSDTSFLQSIEIFALRASDQSPLAKTNLYKKSIEKNNIGQDLPFILNQTPSVQVNSDAGNGIGYTGIRIRGTDATRINVTLNDIPYNDAESQGVYFVNLPDIATSASSVQIQRGVGTSTNGAGAFGGSININTNEIVTKPFLQFDNNSGSFQSFRNTLQLNSGLLKNKFILSGRLSQISSNGYIERAKSNLRSFFSSAVWVKNNKSLRLNVFSGKEKTYAAWFGIDEKMLNENRRYNPAGTEKAGEPYDNETDNYLQTHYQLFYNNKINPNWKSNIAVFLTRGKGYFEQYKANQSLSAYNLPDYINGTDTVKEINLVRRLWLDNYFYGTVFSLQYQRNQTNLIIGGSVNQYYGKHYGEIIESETPMAAPPDYKWYQLTAVKKETALYIKWTQKLNSHWQTFIDLQGRLVNYNINGFKDNPLLYIKNNYFFFNPKAGIRYTKQQTTFYISYAKAGKEPNRDDFETNINEAPLPEKLHDFESCIEQQFKNGNWSLQFFYMYYINQLVLTGKVNDVYAYTRTNIPRSYRADIELSGSYHFNQWISTNGNACISTNKVKNYTAYIDNYDDGLQQTNFYSKASLSFSPSLIANASLIINPFKNMEINFSSKYVSAQYLDNTSNENRKLNDYFLQDCSVRYAKENKKGKSWSIFVKANNIFSKKYVPNGYTFSYIYGGEQTTENYFYPMATFNFMAGFGIKL